MPSAPDCHTCTVTIISMLFKSAVSWSLFSFQFFTPLAAVFAKEVADLFLFEVVELVVSFTFRLK
jgi:hypothetical protein